MCGNHSNQYSSWVKMPGSVRGRPLVLELPIQKVTVRRVCWLLAWRPTSLAAHRARLLSAPATPACMRVNEVVRLQGCDLWFDYLTASRGRARCTSIGERTTWLGGKGITRSLPLEGSCARHRGAAADVDAGRQGGVTVVTDQQCSRQHVSYWILWAVAQAGGDSTRFSSISARKGCIPAAMAAGVDMDILSCTCKAAMVRLLRFARSCT